jgi:hypothetical protein
VLNGISAYHLAVIRENKTRHNSPLCNFQRSAAETAPLPATWSVKFTDE